MRTLGRFMLGFIIGALIMLGFAGTALADYMGGIWPTGALALADGAVTGRTCVWCVHATHGDVRAEWTP